MSVDKGALADRVVWRKIAEFLRLKRKASAVESRMDAAGASSAGHQPHGRSRRSFDTTEAILGEHAPVAHVQILNLDLLKAKASKHWPFVESRIQLLVENTLSRHLDKNDSFVQLDPNSYAIFFSSAGPAEAELRTELLGKELWRLLFAATAESVGELEPPVDVSVNVFDAPLADPQDEEEFAASIHSLAEKHHAIRSGAELTASRALGLATGLKAELNELIGETSVSPNPDQLERIQALLDRLRGWARELNNSHGDAFGGLSANASGGREGHLGTSNGANAIASAASGGTVRERAQCDIWDMIKEIEDSLSRLPRKDSNRVSATRFYADDAELIWKNAPSLKLFYSVDYLPIVDIRLSVIGIHRARIRFSRSSDDMDCISQSELKEQKALMRLADRLLIQAVIRDAILANNFNQVVTIGVSEETLSTIGTRRAYLQEEVSRIPLQMRRAIAFEIVLSGSHRLDVISRWVEELAPFCRAIFLRLRSSADAVIFNIDQVSALANSRLVAIGIEVSPHAEEIRLKKEMASLVDVAHSRGLRAYVTDIPKHSIFLSAASVGVGYVTGATLFPAVQFPTAPVQASLSDLVIKLSANF